MANWDGLGEMREWVVGIGWTRPMASSFRLVWSLILRIILTNLHTSAMYLTMPTRTSCAAHTSHYFKSSQMLTWVSIAMLHHVLFLVRLDRQLCNLGAPAVLLLRWRK